MLRCMYSGISGMKVNQSKLDVIGNNIANVGTTAFKASKAQFSDMLYQNSAVATSPTANKGGTNASQVGLGAKLSSIDRIMSQGNMLATGRTLDAAIDGDGYFILGSGPVDYAGEGTTIGAEHNITGGSMSISYTRDGNLKLDHEGNLVTSDGYRVMGYVLTDIGNEEGAEVTDESVKSIDENGVNYVKADGNLRAVGGLQPLKIPNSVIIPATTEAPAGEGESSDGGAAAAASTREGEATTTTAKIASFSIGKNGVIEAVLEDGTRTAIGQIATATFKNPEGLTAIGGNKYQVSSNSGTEIIKTSVNAENGNDKAYGEIVQGCLEASNVDLTEQFTDMISATRSFQASSKMITTGDEILQTVTGLMR